MPNKSLGQHWLKDRLILEAITDCAELTGDDTVLEIGPGPGTLTSVLLARARQVVAVEYDAELARKLPGQFPGKRLSVINEDILRFDLSTLPDGYIVVANLPYYITSKIISRLVTAEQLPKRMVLLVQQEVAEKYAAGPGKLSGNALYVQNRYDIQLGIRVPKMYFTPPPLVDSQVLLCKKRDVSKIAEKDMQTFRRVVQAGFSAPRKKLRSNLVAGLQCEPKAIDALLDKAGIAPNARAQDLSLEQWSELL